VSNVNFLKISILFMVLSTTVSTMTRNKPVITVLNNYNLPVKLETIWRDKNAPHQKKSQINSIDTGKSLDIKAPISTYDFYQIIAKVSYNIHKIKTRVSDSINSSLVIGDQLAHGNNYFVLSEGNFLIHSEYHNVEISGFENIDKYQKSLEAA